MENTKNLILLFPGKYYAVTYPLLFYAYSKYERKGYECVAINYGDFENFDDAKDSAMAQIEKLNFSSYDDIIFLSKSIGTVIAGIIEETLCGNINNIRHIYLTPIKNTLPYLKKEKNVSRVIAGTKDPHLDINILAEHCSQEGIKLDLIENADHNLEVSDDVIANIDILKQVVELY